METITGDDIGLDLFLCLEEDNENLGIFIGHVYGASRITLQDFIDESKLDMNASLRTKYAAAFEIMAKQLRETT